MDGKIFGKSGSVDAVLVVEVPPSQTSSTPLEAPSTAPFWECGPYKCKKQLKELIITTHNSSENDKQTVT